MSDTVERPDQLSGRTIYGHPLGLANLFGIELWERFSYYGMQGILLYYLYYSLDQGGLGLSQNAAASVVGAYGGLVYLATVLGCWIADRLLGSEKTLFYGGVLVLIGHIALAILPGLGGVAVGLVCVALGSGALKGNATTLVGTLYAEGDPRQDGGFALFYMGVNLGAFFGPLLTGLLQSSLGFHFGFGLAAIGMALGLAQYAAFRRANLTEAGRQVPNPLERGARLRATLVGLAIVVVIALGALSGLVTLSNLAVVATAVEVLAAIIYFVIMLISKKVSSVERSRVIAFVPLFIASVAFWSMFQQIFTVLSIYSDQRMDWNIFGFDAPPSWLQAEEPIWVILLAPVFAILWTKWGTRQPSVPIKFAIGTAGMGVAFLLFLPFSTGVGRTTPALAVLGILLVFALAELFLSPNGLSVSTKLAPRAFRAQMVALYFLSVSVGSSLSGVMKTFYSIQHESAYFGITGLVAIGVGLLIAALSPWVRKKMHGVR